MTNLTDFTEASLAAENPMPWKGVLADVTEEATTAYRVMQDAGLDWRVDERRLGLLGPDGCPMTDEDGGLLTAPKHKAIVRSTDTKVLGVVTNGYVPLQNHEAFAFVDDLVADGQCSYEQAGTVDGGKSIFIQARLPEGGEVAPGDVVWPFLTLVNYHDGGGSVHCGVSSIRIWCGNTQRAAIQQGRNAKKSLSVRHTASMHSRLDEVRLVISWAQGNFAHYLNAARQLARTQISAEHLKPFFLDTFQYKPEDLEKKGGSAKGRLEKLTELFETGKGNDKPAVRGTAWAAVNAVTEYVDHHMPTSVRGSQNMSEAEKATATRQKRFQASQIGSSADVKDRAMQKALELVGA